MAPSNVHLLDLPNEILFYILNKLENVDILYSFFGINNERLDSIIRKKNLSNILNFSSTIGNTTIIDRFCNFILPQISSNVKCLIVEPVMMERILLATHYPNLTELKLSNFERDKSLHYFTDDSSFRYVFKQQITKLEIMNIDREHGALSVRYLPLSSFSSSTLTYLSVHVDTFTDCLCILAGRLKQLRTFIVQIYSLNTDLSLVNNLDDLPNLKCFSLIYYGLIEECDNKIVSLIHRMSYLEKLTLYLRIICENVFVDPMSILNQFSMHMSRLYSFKFYLSTNNNRNDLIRYLSNDGIKQNSMNIRYQEVSNMVCFTVNTAIYHVFTVSFEFAILISLGKIFPNIIFNNVLELRVNDGGSFEHEFFLRIAQAFPSLKSFSVTDGIPLSYNAKKSSDNIQSTPQIVEYLHLTSLDISRTGIDCIEQFLNETKTYLPRLTQSRIIYEGLRIVTKDFTREVTRRNCVNVTRLITEKQIAGSKDYYIHFPLL